MKKIMFNDKYGLTCAVLEGRKTMTRRAVTRKQLECIRQYSHGDEEEFRYRLIANAPYKVGDIVAIAQRYVDIIGPDTTDEMFDCYSGAGILNKMFVKAEYMPHHIKITDIKVEALAGISDDDCLKEGIYGLRLCESDMYVYTFQGDINGRWETPYLAYKELIDRLNKRGFFESNPIVYAYTYELID